MLSSSPESREYLKNKGLNNQNKGYQIKVNVKSKNKKKAQD